MKHKTLLNKSASLLEHVNSEGKDCFSLNDACMYLPDSNRTAIKSLLCNMLKRGLLMRIKEGIYYVIPYDQDPKDFMPDWNLIAPYLVGDAKYYIGYYSSMQVHSLTTQPALREQIVVNKQIKPSTLKIKGIPFRFIYHNEKHFFGNKKIWVDKFNKIECSDLEKTFIDALFNPEYAGGISEIVKAMYKTKDKIDFDKLLDYAIRFDSISVCKRLGYLLELMKINTPIIESLQKIKTGAYFPLEPSWPKNGKRLSKWNVQLNIDEPSILSSIFT